MPQRCFSLICCDVSTCDPSEGTHFALPPGVGALLLHLLPVTKSSPYVTVDVILASSFSSGLSPLAVWHTCFACCCVLRRTDGPLFHHANGSSLTSQYFHTHHLIHLLHLQCHVSNVTLLPYDDMPGNTIEAEFYSFHTYCNGGRPCVSQKRDFNVHQATPAETTEHGCWRTHGSPSANMPTHYREWTLENRIYIALLCM